jgi:hypothetical protein
MKDVHSEILPPLSRRTDFEEKLLAARQATYQNVPMRYLPLFAPPVDLQSSGGGHRIGATERRARYALARLVFLP